MGRAWQVSNQQGTRLLQKDRLRKRVLAGQSVPIVLQQSPPILGGLQGVCALQRDSWRRSGEGGRENISSHKQTPSTPAHILAGHRQLLVLFLFIPDLCCPFYFPPF